MTFQNEFVKKSDKKFPEPQSFGQRIAQIRNGAGLTQEALADALGIKRSALAQIETTGKRLDPDLLVRIVRHFNIPYEYLFEGNVVTNSNKGAEVNEEAAGYGKDAHLNVHPNVHPSRKDKTKGAQIERPVRPVMVTVDHHLKEVITFVPVKAQAGYTIGYGDPEYLKELPTFGFPGFNHGTFRAFEVEGESMLQYEGAGLYPKDIVITEFVENPVDDIRDNRVYVVISDQGVLIKRCVNRLGSHQKLICNSDNKNGDYPPKVLEAYEIREVWEFKSKMSRQIPRATRVFEDITDVQTKQTLMEEELKKVNEQLRKLSALLEKPKEK